MTKKDPIGAFIKDAEMSPESQRRYDEARGRRSKELAYWHTWNDSGRKEEHLQPLLKSLQPLIRSETNKRLQGLGGSIPRSALESELQNATMRALQTFDPSKGAQLSTHVTGNFMRSTDFIAANRNAKYMPREDVERFGSFHNAREELHEELGREPTSEELATKLPDWSGKRIKKMMKGFGAEVYTDMGTEFDGQAADLSPHDAFQLIKSRMTPEEQRFGAMHFDPEGKRPSIPAIAKALGINEHRAYRIKAKVEEQVGGVLKGE